MTLSAIINWIDWPLVFSSLYIALVIASFRTWRDVRAARKAREARRAERAARMGAEPVAHQ